jgi:hypothetical protein
MRRRRAGLGICALLCGVPKIGGRQWGIMLAGSKEVWGRSTRKRCCDQVGLPDISVEPNTRGWGSKHRNWSQIVRRGSIN